MYYKTLSVLALSAAALAAPQENNWDSQMQEAADISPEEISAAVGIFANPTSLAQAAMIPTSAAESIVAAIPSGYVQNLASNPSVFESVANDLATGKYPDWYSSEVPASIQTQIAASASALSGDLPSELSSLSVSASATSTASSSDSTSASSSESTSTSASASGSESASASSSATDNGAAAPTAMAMGVAGAAGVLGLALVL